MKHSTVFKLVLAYLMLGLFLAASALASQGEGCFTYKYGSKKGYQLFVKPNDSSLVGESYSAVRLKRINSEFSLAFDSTVSGRALAYVKHKQLEELPERNCGDEFEYTPVKRINIRQGSFNSDYHIYLDNQLSKVKETVDPEFTQPIGYCTPLYCEVVDYDYNLTGYVKRKGLEIGIILK